MQRPSTSLPSAPLASYTPPSLSRFCSPSLFCSPSVVLFLRPASVCAAATQAVQLQHGFNTEVCSCNTGCAAAIRTVLLHTSCAAATQAVLTHRAVCQCNLLKCCSTSCAAATRAVPLQHRLCCCNTGCAVEKWTMKLQLGLCCCNTGYAAATRAVPPQEGREGQRKGGREGIMGRRACCSSTACVAAAHPVLHWLSSLLHRLITVLQRHSMCCSGTQVLQCHSLCCIGTARAAAFQSRLQSW